MIDHRRRATLAEASELVMYCRLDVVILAGPDRGLAPRELRQVAAGLPNLRGMLLAPTVGPALSVGRTAGSARMPIELQPLLSGSAGRWHRACRSASRWRSRRCGSQTEGDQR
jgi:hypothetical protein